MGLLQSEPDSNLLVVIYNQMNFKSFIKLNSIRASCFSTLLFTAWLTEISFSLLRLKFKLFLKTKINLQDTRDSSF